MTFPFITKYNAFKTTIITTINYTIPFVNKPIAVSI